MYSNELVCNLLDIINNNINNEITIDDLSMKLYFNKTYIMKRFKKELNITIHQYINSMRIFNSLNLYLYDNTILSIALKNGFNSLEYYSETFRKIIGVSPSMYKKYVLRDIRLPVKYDLIISINMNKLYILRNKINKYLSHRKPNRNYNRLFL